MNTYENEEVEAADFKNNISKLKEQLEDLVIHQKWMKEANCRYKEGYDDLGELRTNDIYSDSDFKNTKLNIHLTRERIKLLK